MHTRGEYKACVVGCSVREFIFSTFVTLTLALYVLFSVLNFISYVNSHKTDSKPIGNTRSPTLTLVQNICEDI